MAIGVAELVERPFDQLAGAQDDPGRDEDVLHFAAIGAAVHPDEAADGARDSAQEFEAGDAVVAGGRGDQDAGRTAAAMERGLVELLDFRERLAEADDDSGYAAVADDQVGAEAERHQGYVRIELSQELDEVVLIGRLEQPLGRPAAT